MLLGMNPYYKEKLRGILEEKIKRVSEDIERLEEGVKPVPPDKGLGRITRMEVLSDKARNEAAMDQACGLLCDLEHALEHIDDKTFGACATCKQLIPDERLLAMPGARFCMRCATAR